jgi:hypothetical protein
LFAWRRGSQRKGDEVGVGGKCLSELAERSAVDEMGDGRDGRLLHLLLLWRLTGGVGAANGGLNGLTMRWQRREDHLPKVTSGRRPVKEFMVVDVGDLDRPLVRYFRIVQIQGRLDTVAQADISVESNNDCHRPPFPDGLVSAFVDPASVRDPFGEYFQKRLKDSKPLIRKYS